MDGAKAAELHGRFAYVNEILGYIKLMMASSLAPAIFGNTRLYRSMCPRCESRRMILPGLPIQATCMSEVKTCKNQGFPSCSAVF